MNMVARDNCIKSQFFVTLKARLVLTVEEVEVGAEIEDKGLWLVAAGGIFDDKDDVDVSAVGVVLDAFVEGKLVVAEAWLLVDWAKVIVGDFEEVVTTDDTREVVVGGFGDVVAADDTRKVVVSGFGDVVATDDARGVVHNEAGSPRSASIDAHDGTVEGQQQLDPVQMAPLGQHPTGQSKKGL
jgi:hypothetical protein